MKVFTFLVLFFALVVSPAIRYVEGTQEDGVGQYQHWRHQGAPLHRKLGGSEDASAASKSEDLWNYGQIQSDDSDDTACIEVKNGRARRGQKLILGDCIAAEKNGWRGDANGLLHSEIRDDFCIQAGHGGPAKSGEYARMYECDPRNQLQQWVFINGGGIRPLSNQALCIVWRGVNDNIGKDPLILKPCDEVEGRNDWSNDPFPDDENEEDVRSPCVDRDVPQFIIDDNIDIGDTLVRPGPAFAVQSGPDSYTVKDNGDDPPFDPELGDTLRFAYKEITSNAFSMKARVCGLDCDPGSYAGVQLYYGRTGLMVRDSLDPLARNVFVSHSPEGQADWSYRTEEGGETTFGMDGSPDVTCLWVFLSRDGNVFSASYAYEGDSECDTDPIEDPQLTFTIDMPEVVYIGLAISTGVSPPYCSYTEADFRDIECQGC